MPLEQHRAEDEGRAIVEAAILTAITVVDTLDEAGRCGEHLSGNIAEAVMWALDQIGPEDHEALAQTTLAKLDGHDPETRS